MQTAILESIAFKQTTAGRTLTPRSCFVDILSIYMPKLNGRPFTHVSLIMPVCMIENRFRRMSAVFEVGTRSG
jgi:hypothetical protein